MVPPTQNQGGVPLQAVVDMRSKGVSDHMIIDELTKQGYASIDIFEALTQADNHAEPVLQPNTVSSQPAPAPAVSSASTPVASGQRPEKPVETPRTKEERPQPDVWSMPPSKESVETVSKTGMESPFTNSNQSSYGLQEDTPDLLKDMSYQPENSQTQQSTVQSTNPFPPSLQQHSQETPQGNLDIYADKLDEIAEAIIDEKWKEMKTYIEKMVEWKSRVENRILKIESETKMLRDEIIALQKGIMDKVQTYDRHITDVATEIKAMERVFQKIIPSLTENVTELSRVVNHMRGNDNTQ
ncbi:MAG: hypothetical protein ACMXYL_04915 [Candidatus Woesearchaeota archaeon]